MPSFDTCPVQAPAPFTGPTWAPAPTPYGNAATQAELGLAAPAPDTGGSLLDLLPTLGELADLVLDAMPLANAVRLAWAQRDAPWARRWMGGRTLAELADAAPDLVEAWAAELVPEGFGVTLGASVGGGLVAVSLEGGGTLTAWREPGTVRFAATGLVTAGAGPSAGFEFTGVDGVVHVGHAIAAGLKETGTVDVAGVIDLGAAVREVFATRAWAELDRERPGPALVQLLARALAGPGPFTRVESLGRRDVDLVEASATAVDLGGGKAEGSAAIATACGIDGGRPFVEVELSASTAATPGGIFLVPFLNRGIDLERLKRAGLRGLRLRAWGKLAAGGGFVGPGPFDVTLLGQDHPSTAETATFQNLAEAEAWLVALLGGGGDASGGGVTAAELPEVVLSRSANPLVLDARLPELEDALPRVPGPHLQTLGRRRVESARMDLRVKATPAAIRVAAGVAALPVPAGGPAALALEIGRVLLARAYGETLRTDLPLAEADLDAALPLLKVEVATQVVTCTMKSAAGVSGPASGKGQLDVGWFQRIDLSDRPLPELRAWFLD